MLTQVRRALRLIQEAAPAGDATAGQQGAAGVPGAPGAGGGDALAPDVESEVP
jgi:hypothetical protein